MVQLNQVTLGYFTTMAQIAATLLGLSFLALTFYLQGVFDRIKLALPVFRHEDRYRRRAAMLQGKGGASSTAPHRLTSDSMLDFADASHIGPDSFDAVRNSYDLTDLQVFDGDPLVVFLAYSTALSWNLYFLSLVLSVTFIAANPVPVWVIALEATMFLALMVYDNGVRRQQYARLLTYLTREERLVPVLEWVVLSIYGVFVLYAWWGAFGWPAPMSLTAGSLMQYTVDVSRQIFVPSFQIIVLLAFCGGLYVTNKDLFIYFKAKVSDDMRAKWLEQFGPAYRTLREDVTARLSGPDVGQPDVERLRQLWNGGKPSPAYYTRPLGAPSDTLWRRLTHGEAGVTIAPFMLDVPAIAAWFYDVEQRLDDLGDQLSSAGAQ